MSNAFFHFFGTDKDYFKVMFEDLLNSQDTIYYDFEFSRKKSLFRILSIILKRNVLNCKRIRLFKKFVFFLFLRSIKICKTKRNVFVFFGHSFELADFDCFDFIRKKIPDCKLFFYIEDNVSYFKNWRSDFDLDYLKRKFDFVLSYNKLDAQRYSLVFHPLFYPMNKALPPHEKEYDVFFAGSNKNRLNKLISVYDELTNQGMKCMFFILGVDEKNQVVRPGIVYNKCLNYHQIIEYMSRSSGILELITNGFEGFTLRVLEALTFDKILFTDNFFLKEVFAENAPIIYLDSNLQNSMKRLATIPFNWGEKKFSGKQFVSDLTAMIDG